MPFRFNKRVKLSSGLGLNIGKRGVSASVRTKFGSIGSRGISVKTGVPGLTLRSSSKLQISSDSIEVREKKRKSLFDIFFYIIVAPFVVIYIVIKFVFWDWWH